MELIIAFTKPWKEGYHCQKAQYDYINDRPFRMDFIASDISLILPVALQKETVAGFDNSEIEVDVRKCKLEIFAEDGSGFRSFAVLIVPPEALKVRI